jgi:hypothetical protein
MMRTLLWVTLLMFSVGTASTAHADTTSALDFGTTTGQAPTSGLIDCDSAGCPNSISATIDWEGLVFTFSDAALTAGLEPDSYFAGNPNCDVAAGPSALVYQSLNNCSPYHGWATAEVGGNWLMALDTATPGLFVLVTGVGTPDADAVASGGSFIDPVPTPEPTSGGLLLVGVALLGSMWMRQTHPQSQTE